MKYKVGDKVRIKSFDWYNENRDKIGQVDCGCGCVYAYFVPPMVSFCGQIVTISSILPTLEVYRIKEDDGEFNWTDEMIERLVEEDKPKFKIGDKITNGKESFIVLQIASNKYIIEDNLGEYDTLYFDSQNDWGLVREKVRTINEPLFKTSNMPLEKEIEWSLPEGYVFKDENGNVINATKIVLEKKKKEYPKTYEGCAKELGYNQVIPKDHILGYMGTLLSNFQQLLICRDAYWQIAGEEMGLEKPWGTGDCKIVYGICREKGNIVKRDDYFGGTHTFEFPIREMRDAFYENFKELIENCKELM